MDTRITKAHPVSSNSLQNNEPFIQVTFKSIVPFIAIAFVNYIFLAYIAYTISKNSLSLPLSFALLLSVCVTAFCTFYIIARLKRPVTSEIYENGIWFNDFGLFVPYELVESVDLLYQGDSRIARLPAVYVSVSPEEHKEYASRFFNLKIGNIKTPENLLKINLGVVDHFMQPPSDEVVRMVHDLAARRASALGISPPELRIDAKS